MLALLPSALLFIASACHKQDGLHVTDMFRGLTFESQTVHAQMLQHSELISLAESWCQTGGS